MAVATKLCARPRAGLLINLVPSKARCMSMLASAIFTRLPQGETMAELMNGEAQPQWHIVQRENGQCQIVTDVDLPDSTGEEAAKTWGPFGSQGEAIARRVGLIRAGKCQPM